LQYCPAGWIQTIAANFFAGKFFPLENYGSQTGERAKRRAARSGWAAAHDGNIEHVHHHLVSRKGGGDKAIFGGVMGVLEQWSDWMQLIHYSSAPLLHYSMPPNRHWRAIK
jgi:hypothetical protein